MKSILLAGLGFFFLALGAIGLLLPVWPTTPFVLASAACFSSAPRCKSRIMGFPFFRDHMENYAHRRGLSKKTTGISLGFLWGMLLLSMLTIRTVWALCLLPVVGSAVTVHILLMARAKRGSAQDNQRGNGA